jgi:hypothetical protein
MITTDFSCKATHFKGLQQIESKFAFLFSFEICQYFGFLIFQNTAIQNMGRYCTYLISTNQFNLTCNTIDHSNINYLGNNLIKLLSLI